MRMAYLFGITLLCSSLGACTSLAPSACMPDETPALQDTLYFGTGIPQGGVVTDEDWQTFLEAEVTPRFPAGLTLFDADGQWLGENGQIVQEQTHVLQLVHANDAATNAAVDNIIQAYKRQFSQEAVLRVRTRACMAL